LQESDVEKSALYIVKLKILKFILKKTFPDWKLTTIKKLYRHPVYVYTYACVSS